MKNIRTVWTAMKLSAPPARAWEELVFYEQIEERPPLLLRWLLPEPVLAHGSKSRPGDESVCVYAGGRLFKKITSVEPGRLCAFEVVGQDLPIGGGIRLLRGSYELKPADDGGTWVRLTTVYASPWPGLFAALEAAVCHAFHRFILGNLREKTEGAPQKAAVGALAAHAGNH